MSVVLVTGGAGFIGSHLVGELLQESAAQHTVVVVLDNFSGAYSVASHLAPFEGHERLIIEKADITDASAVFAIVARHNPDVIVHLAARAGVRASFERPQEYSLVNVTGTINVLEAARKHSVSQVIFGSSSSVYGDRSDAPFSEDDRADSPISPYAATKRAAELLCYAYHTAYRLNITLRFFTVYGERCRPDMAVFKFMDAIAHDRPISVYGEGTRRDYTYVGDIVQGILAAINASLPFEIINLGNASPVQLPELIGAIEFAVGKKAQIVREPAQQGDVQQTFADTKSQNIIELVRENQHC